MLWNVFSFPEGETEGLWDRLDYSLFFCAIIPHAEKDRNCWHRTGSKKLKRKETIPTLCTFHSLFAFLGQPVRSHLELLFEKSLSSTCAKKCYTCLISPSHTHNLCFCCLLTPTDLVTVPANQSQICKPGLSFFNVDYRHCWPLKIQVHGKVLFYQFSCNFSVSVSKKIINIRGEKKYLV